MNDLLALLPLILAVLGPMGALASMLVPLAAAFPRAQALLRLVAALGMDVAKAGSALSQAATNKTLAEIHAELHAPKDDAK